MIRSRRHNFDIKAPDGYTLGGLRLVRSDATVLFQRGWWKTPDGWVGERIWIHESHEGVEAAPPGYHIYEAQGKQIAVPLLRTERPDAERGFRKASSKAWLERIKAMSAARLMALQAPEDDQDHFG
jgi:hypothetical protein